MKTIQLASEAVVLHPEKALYWPREATLFVADIHVGKVAAFRSAGVPLPPGSTTAVLKRLSRVVNDTQAKRIVFLGDFLHSQAARAELTFARFLEWREVHEHIKITLVRGNHDKHAGDPPANWQIDCINEGEIAGPFCLAHHPAQSSNGYVLAGHIHPAIRLNGRANDSLRLACFWVGEHVMVLPAFGEFTGMHVVKPKVGDRIFVVADGAVVEVR